jgi:hypothetical protein
LLDGGAEPRLALPVVRVTQENARHLGGERGEHLAQPAVPAGRAETVDTGRDPRLDTLLELCGQASDPGQHWIAAKAAAERTY